MSHNTNRIKPHQTASNKSYCQGITIILARLSLALRATVALSPSPSSRAVPVSSTRKVTDFVKIMSKLTKDQLKSPVPSDIEISQSLEGSLSHIAKVAEAAGVLESEMEPYGHHKGKVG